MHKLTIIIVSYKSHDPIRNNLSEILAMNDFKTFIVENSNEEDAINALHDISQSTEILTPHINLGYGRAANLGLRISQTPYTLLLNPDLRTNREEILKLLEVAKSDIPNTAIWAPATLNRDYIKGAKPKSVKWVSGCAMLFDTAKIKAIGGFDENIFLFSEDTDLCDRIINSGHAITLCQNIYFQHTVGQSSPPDSKTDYMKWWHFGWSQCYRLTKHGKTTFWRNPTRKYISYLLHGYLSTSIVKRKKWKAKADGSLAFIQGTKAFREDNTPQMS